MGASQVGTAEQAAHLYADAVAAADRGQLRDALALSQRALRRLGLDGHGAPLREPAAVADPERDRLAARILLSQAFPQHELGRRPLARRSLDDAARIAAQQGFDDLQTLVHAQRGLLLIRSGQPAQALPDLDQAIAGLDRAPAADQVKIVINRGEVHHQLGRLAAARSDFRRAITLARELGDPELSFYATHNLGFMEHLGGDLPTALAVMPTVDQAETDFQRGVVGMDRAKVLLAAGLTTEADQTLVEACTALERTEFVPFLAEAELTRAEAALLSDHPGLALALSRRAIGRLRRHTQHRAATLGRLVVLRARAATGAHPARLVKDAERLAGQLDELQLLDQARLARLIATETAIGSGHTDLSPPRLRAKEPIDLRLHLRLVRTQLAFARGDLQRGRREVRRGLGELSDYQAGFGSLDLQTASSAHGVGLAAAGVNEAVAADRPAAALDLLERIRSISGRVPAVRPPADEQTAELLSQLRWVVAQLDEARAAGRRDTRLLARRTSLERQIRARSWTSPGALGVRKTATLGQLRAAAAGATVVALFALRDQLHAIVVTPTRSRLQPLVRLGAVTDLVRRAQGDLDVLALDQVPAALRQTAARSLQSTLRALDAVLLAPLGLPDRPVTVLPPGPLAGLPWAQLPTLAGRPLTVAPSGGAWLAARTRAETPGTGVVAIAGPGLGRAEQEVAEVARSWSGCRVLSGPAATGSAVLRSIDGAGLVHVAAHGHHQRDSPLFSSIGLADGPLVGYDLDRLRQAPTQVVLSACELGQASVRVGDEALGLTRALLHAGSATVVAGVARVGDHSAAQLMADYHHRLATGSRPAVALADALTTADEPMPFVCFGTG